MSTKEKLIKTLKDAKYADFEDIHLLFTQLGFSYRKPYLIMRISE